MPFQTAVSTTLGLGVAGDFAGHNPRIYALAGPGSIIAGPGGVNVGTFAWLTSLQDPDNAPSIATNTGFGAVGTTIGSRDATSSPAARATARISKLGDHAVGH